MPAHRRRPLIGRPSGRLARYRYRRRRYANRHDRDDRYARCGGGGGIGGSQIGFASSAPPKQVQQHINIYLADDVANKSADKHQQDGHAVMVSSGLGPKPLAPVYLSGDLSQRSSSSSSGAHLSDDGSHLNHLSGCNNGRRKRCSAMIDAAESTDAAICGADLRPTTVAFGQLVAAASHGQVGRWLALQRQRQRRRRTCTWAAEFANWRNGRAQTAVSCAASAATINQVRAATAAATTGAGEPAAQGQWLALLKRGHRRASGESAEAAAQQRAQEQHHHHQQQQQGRHNNCWPNFRIIRAPRDELLIAGATASPATVAAAAATQVNSPTLPVQHQQATQLALLFLLLLLLCGPAASNSPAAGSISPAAGQQATSDLTPLPVPAYRWPFVSLVGFMFLGAAGNILVCMAIWRERRLQTATNYFLLSLAVADLLVCTLVMPFGIIYEFYGHWPFDDWRVCNLWVTCDVLTCSSSILHMCFISVGRYLGIRNPLHARQANLFVSRRAVLWRIAIAWMSAALIASPITMMSLLDLHNIIPARGECAISNKYFLMFGSMVAFFLPMLAMIPSYIMTVRLLSARAKYVRNNSLLATAGRAAAAVAAGGAAAVQPLSDSPASDSQVGAELAADVDHQQQQQPPQPRPQLNQGRRDQSQLQQQQQPTKEERQPVVAPEAISAAQWSLGTQVQRLQPAGQDDHQHNSAADPLGRALVEANFIDADGSADEQAPPPPPGRQPPAPAAQQQQQQPCRCQCRRARSCCCCCSRKHPTHSDSSSVVTCYSLGQKLGGSGKLVAATTAGCLDDDNNNSAVNGNFNKQMMQQQQQQQHPRQNHCRPPVCRHRQPPPPPHNHLHHHPQCSADPAMLNAPLQPADATPLTASQPADPKAVSPPTPLRYHIHRRYHHNHHLHNHHHHHHHNHHHHHHHHRHEHSHQRRPHHKQPASTCTCRCPLAEPELPAEIDVPAAAAAKQMLPADEPPEPASSSSPSSALEEPLRRPQSAVQAALLGAATPALPVLAVQSNRSPVAEVPVAKPPSAPQPEAAAPTPAKSVPASGCSRQSSQNSANATNQRHPNLISIDHASSDPPQMIRYLGSSMQVRSEQKATKVLGLVFFTFVICWSPFFLVNFFQAFATREELNYYVSNELMTVFLWLGYISSTINPVIYTVFNRNFRKAFRQLILCRPANHRYRTRTRNCDHNKSFRFSQRTGGHTAATGLTTGNGGPNSSLYSAHRKLQAAAAIAITSKAAPARTHGAPGGSAGSGGAAITGAGNSGGGKESTMLMMDERQQVQTPAQIEMRRQSKLSQSSSRNVTNAIRSAFRGSSGRLLSSISNTLQSQPQQQQPGEVEAEQVGGKTAEEPAKSGIVRAPSKLMVGQKQIRLKLSFVDQTNKSSGKQ